MCDKLVRRSSAGHPLGTLIRVGLGHHLRVDSFQCSTGALLDPEPLCSVGLLVGDKALLHCLLVEVHETDQCLGHNGGRASEDGLIHEHAVGKHCAGDLSPRAGDVLATHALDGEVEGTGEVGGSQAVLHAVEHGFAKVANGQTLAVAVKQGVGVGAAGSRTPSDSTEVGLSLCEREIQLNIDAGMTVRQGVGAHESGIRAQLRHGRVADIARFVGAGDHLTVCFGKRFYEKGDAFWTSRLQQSR